jgi:hypothetical protein
MKYVGMRHGIHQSLHYTVPPPTAYSAHLLTVTQLVPPASACSRLTSLDESHVIAG